MAKQYGVCSGKGETDVPIRRIGCCLVSVAIVAWVLIVRDAGDYSTHQSFALATLPWILEFLGSTLNDEPRKYGFSAITNNAMLALDVLLVAGLLSDSDPWANAATKMALLVWLVNAIGFTLLPQYGEKVMWGMKDRCETVDHLLYRVCGLGCAQNFVLVYLLDVNKIDPVKALGFSFMVNAAGLILLTIFREKRSAALQCLMLMTLGSAFLTVPMPSE